MKKKLSVLIMAVAASAMAGCGSSAADLPHYDNTVEEEALPVVEEKQEAIAEEPKSEQIAEEMPVTQEYELTFECDGEPNPHLCNDYPEWNLAAVVAAQSEIDPALKEKLQDNNAEPVDFMTRFASGEIDPNQKGDDTDAFFLGESSGFAMFITNTGKFIVKTGDDKYVDFKDVNMFDYIYELMPEYKAGDFDGDGEAELYLEFDGFHGTGFMHESAFIVDKDENGTWLAYHLSPNWLINEVEKRVSIECDDTSIRYVMDNNTFYTYERTDSEPLDNLMMDMALYIEPADSGVTVHIGPVLFGAEINMLGIYTDPINVQVDYKGCGQWAVMSIE